MALAMPSLKTLTATAVPRLIEYSLVHAGVEAVGLLDERDVKQVPLVLYQDLPRSGRLKMVSSGHTGLSL